MTRRTSPRFGQVVRILGAEALVEIPGATIRAHPLRGPLSVGDRVALGRAPHGGWIADPIGWGPAPALPEDAHTARLRPGLGRAWAGGPSRG